MQAVIEAEVVLTATSKSKSEVSKMIKDEFRMLFVLRSEMK